MLYEQAQYLPPRLPRTEGHISFDALEREMRDFAVEQANQRQALVRQFVVFDEESLIDALNRDPAMSATLLEARSQLRTHFGGETIFQLRRSVDEVGNSTLYVVAIWPGQVLAAREALQHFDEWWLAQQRHGQGHVIFTYELV
jgi:hypothetical protein